MFATDRNMFFLRRGNRRSGRGNLPRAKKKPKKVEKSKRRGNPHSPGREKKLQVLTSLEEELASSSSNDDVVVKECRFCGNPEHLHTECLKCGCEICDSEGESVCWICLQSDDVETSWEEPKWCPNCGDDANSDGHDYCDQCGEGFCHSSDKAMHYCFTSEEEMD